MNRDEHRGPSLSGQVLVAVGFFLLGVLITWLGVNDWRLFPTEVASPSATNGPDSVIQTASGDGPSESAEPTPSAEPSEPKMSLLLKPASIEAFDGQGDLVIHARLTSDLDVGRYVQFELKSAPGLSDFDYTIERKVAVGGESTATFRMSPCNLLDLDHQVASAAEGEYLVVVMDMQSGAIARAKLALQLAPAADDFRKWRGGRCAIY